MKTPIGIVDDHQLFLKALSLMLSGFNDFEVVVEALNGRELQEKIKAKSQLPAIMLIDVNMPVMNGELTVAWLSATYPSMKLVALSMEDGDTLIIKMIKAGCCAYLLKDAHPNELEKALKEINNKGYYNSDSMNIDYRRLLKNQEDGKLINISGKEKEFLQLACSDLTYKKIAGLMNVSERTVDGYRETTFAKLNVQTRVGLALECVRRGYFKV